MVAMSTPTSHAKTITRDDVARMAGVSSAVVSYVVNGGPRAVSPGNEAKVRQAIRALGYRPNAAARALALGSSEMLAMIIPDAMNPFFASLSRAVENAAAERGYTLLLADSQASLRTERRLVKNFASRRVDGLFLWSELSDPDLMDFEQADIPVVLLNHSTDLATSGSPAILKHGAGDPGANSVGVAFRDGARLAVEHLIGHGHERIGLVMGTNPGGDVDSREVGWRQGIQDAGLTAGPIIRVPFTREGGYRAGQELLAASDRPTAVFVSSDQQAVALLCALQEGGLRIPEDLAVFAFDGSPESEYTWPRLSTVAQPINDLAHAALEALLAAPGKEPLTHIFPAELVLRTSCGCH
ncbi:LacI family transcriptional regulator [Cryobacterium lactosi]|uniref:LacI family transcriptional regulator n=1 Tax=Cryobacterium lactosi TaxID=1259202 RepID=A0A4R9BZ32_9MICO|nr:LacI family transcriptional regulator [Cryobacterium lactosi]